MSASETAPRTITVRAEPIELCQLLKFAGLADNGGAAKAIISEGRVQLNGVVETQKRKKIMSGDRVTLADETIVVQVSAPIKIGPRPATPPSPSQ